MKIGEGRRHHYITIILWDGVSLLYLPQSKSVIAIGAVGCGEINPALLGQGQIEGLRLCQSIDFCPSAALLHLTKTALFPPVLDRLR
jgi:hypothetical protein